jgi:hypothetical protein
MHLLPFLDDLAMVKAHEASFAPAFAFQDL